MRNKHGYTHIGGQLPRKLSQTEALAAAYGAPRIAGTENKMVRIGNKIHKLAEQLINDPTNHGVPSMLRKAGVIPSQAPDWNFTEVGFEPARYRKGPTLANFIAQNRHAEEEMHRIHLAALDAGFTQGVQDEMIAPSSWSDTQLAALVADMRKQEETKVSQFAQLDFTALEKRCVMDEVQGLIPRFVPLWARPDNTPAGRPLGLTEAQIEIEGQRLKAVFLRRESVPVDSIVQGDKVFMTGDTTPRTVLYVHVSDLFVSLVIISHQDAMPFMVHRHRGGLINKEAN